MHITRRQFMDQRHARRVYIVLSTCAIMIMIIAAYITYGYQENTITVSIAEPEKNETAHTNNALKIGADLSRVPSDTEIDNILNEYLPHVCDDCEDDDPLDCLDRYEITKVLVQEDQYRDQLFLNVLTGKEPKKYTVIIDLAHENAVISASGAIDRKECISEENEDDAEGDEVLLNDGTDPNSTAFIRR